MRANRCECTTEPKAKGPTMTKFIERRKTDQPQDTDGTPDYSGDDE